MKLTVDSINNINVFESLTGARVKDCISDNGELVFLVEEGNVKQAIGTGNSNIIRLKRLLKKEIKVIGFSDDVKKFVRNLIYPVRADDMGIEDGTLTLFFNDNISKGKVFGRGRENLKKINDIVKKYFDVEVEVA